VQASASDSWFIEVERAGKAEEGAQVVKNSVGGDVGAEKEERGAEKESRLGGRNEGGWCVPASFLDVRKHPESTQD
jgi:hypothetical protein